MKKFVALILSLVLLIGFSTSSFAIGVLSDSVRESFMNIDLDYLISYRDAINEIIAERGGEVEVNENASADESTIDINGEPFNEGIYEAGVNIKPGTYRFWFTEVAYGAKVYLYESREKYNSGNSLEHYLSSNETVGYTFTLDKGNVLSIELVAGKGNITISTAKASWMP